MIVKTKNYAAKSIAVGIAAAALHLATPAAAFNVDGIVTGADSYSSTFALDFLVSNVDFDAFGNPASGDQTVSGGILRLGRTGTTGNVFMHLTVPIAVVDNVYGPDSFVLTTDWAPVKHEFSKLVGSDAFEFDISTNDGSKFVKVEYAKGPPEGGPNIKDNEGNVLVDVATSLELNLANGFGTNSGSDPQSPDPNNLTPAEAAGWEQAIQYEFEFDGSLFAAGAIDPSDLAGGILHASPNKLSGSNQVTVPCLGIALGQPGACQPTTTPNTPSISEPASGALLLAGLGLVSLYRRRRMKG